MIPSISYRNLSLTHSSMERARLKSTRLVYRLVETYSVLRKIMDCRNDHDDVTLKIPIGNVLAVSFI